MTVQYNVRRINGKFIYTYKKTTLWFVATFAIGLIVSWQFESGYEKIGTIGLGTVSFGVVIGCFRTGRFFTWDGEVEPNQFEGVLGWSGAALLVAAIIGFTLLVAFEKF